MIRAAPHESEARLRASVSLWLPPYSSRPFALFAYSPRQELRTPCAEECRPQIAQVLYWTGSGPVAEVESMTTLPAQASGLASNSQLRSKKGELKTEDFIKMMITQLQNQDPLEPAKNQELLAQMSQIGQLQSATTLQESLKGMVLQNQIGAAAGLIGKTVQGLDNADQPVTGLVNSVKVTADGVNLELDNGKSLPLSRVTTIAPTKMQ